MLIWVAPVDELYEIVAPAAEKFLISTISPAVKFERTGPAKEAALSIVSVPPLAKLICDDEVVSDATSSEPPS